MPFLNLKNPFEKAPQTDQDYLSLTITPNKVIATVWNFQGEEINVLSTSQKNFGSPETLVHEAAVAIDTAAQDAKTDVSKVVFGLSSYWFDDGKLKPESSKILKNLSDDLELDAQAFVTLAIAINHLLKVQETITPQAILIGTFENFAEIHLLKNNQVSSSRTVSGELTSHKILNALQEIKKDNENLPSKILVFGDNAQDVSSKLNGQSWHELFVHDPKIDTFDDPMLGKSVAFAQAADVLGHDPKIIGSKKHEQVVKEERKENKGVFGFVEGEDILEKVDNEIEETIEPSLKKEVVDVEHHMQHIHSKPLDPKDYAVEISQSDNLAMPPQHSAPTQKHIHKGPKLPSLPKIHIPKIIPFAFSPKKIAIALAAILVLIFVGTYVAGKTLTAAQVIVKTNPKTESFDFNAKVIAGTSNNFDKNEIAGQLVSGSAASSQKAVATGSKKSGSPAKGEIKILNWDKQAEKTFSAATEVITKDGLKFKLDSEVKVASRSATTPGEAKVAATASDIGPKYNIGSGQDLTIVGFDEVFYSGVTESAFSGGDEKQITVASKDDLARLEKSLTDTLTQKARDDLSQKTGGLKIFDESKIVKIVKKIFDKKAEEGAALVNLDMEIEFQGIAYSEDDLKNYLAQLTNKSNSGSLQALPETIDIKDVKVKREKDTLTLSGRYDAGLVPKIEESELKDKIAGKSIKEAREIVKAIGDVADVQFIFTPQLPFVESLPANKSKISFKVEKN